MANSAMERAYNYINESILSGEIMLGSPLNEAEIANTLGISRSPVRESLKLLEAEGLVKYIPGRGTSVIEITRQDIEDIFDMRMLFELEALKNSTKYIGDSFWTDMEKGIQDLGENTEPAAFYEFDKRLHYMIIGNSGNKLLETFYHRLAKLIEIVRRISAQDPMHFSKSKEQHYNIIIAMKEKNFDKASKLLAEHISDVKEHTIVAYTYSISKLKHRSMA